MNPRPIRRGHTRTPEVETAAVEVPKPAVAVPVAPKEHSSKELYDIVMKKISNGVTVPDAKGKAVSIHSVDDAYVYVYPVNWGNGSKSRCKAVAIAEFCKEMKWVS